LRSDQVCTHWSFSQWLLALVTCNESKLASAGPSPKASPLLMQNLCRHGGFSWQSLLRNRRGARALIMGVGRKSVRGHSQLKREQAIYPGLGGASSGKSPFYSPVTALMSLPFLNRGIRNNAEVTAQWPLSLSEERVESGLRRRSQA
jgi:hypothetical protein